jgi:hypothetical protein
MTTPKFTMLPDGVVVPDYVIVYLETAMWCTHDESTEDGGEPFDANYTVEDFAPEALAQATKDCDAFLARAGDMVNALGVDMAMHDFWLTREGHGAGFWDGDWPDPDGDKLTEIAESFGACPMYLGDDKRIYFA